MGADEESREINSWHANGYAVILGVSFMVCALAYITFSKEEEPWLVVILLLVPVLHLRYTADKSPDIVFYSAFFLFLVLWGFYIINPYIPSWVLEGASIASGLLAVAVVILAFAATWVALSSAEGSRARGHRWVSHIRERVPNDPFFYMCFFLTLFALATYYLGFSLAFHDKFHRIEVGVPALVTTQSLEGLKQERVLRDYSDSLLPRGSWKILFDKGSSSVDYDKELMGVSRESLKTIEDKEPSEKLRRIRQAENVRALSSIVDEISCFNDFRRVRVLLVGHANDEPFKAGSTTYRSNYDLSEARTNQVMLEIIRRLEKRVLQERMPANCVGPGSKMQRQLGSNASSSVGDSYKLWFNVEWMRFPVSSEDTYLKRPEVPGESDGKVEGEDPDERLSVEVSILPVAEYPLQSAANGEYEMELLEYMYFMIYTITTTAYGDIVPVSRFAKMVSSVANFFEIFFLVIFFNVLVSWFSRDKQGVAGKSASMAAGSAGAPLEVAGGAATSSSAAMGAAAVSSTETGTSKSKNAASVTEEGEAPKALEAATKALEVDSPEDAISDKGKADSTESSADAHDVAADPHPKKHSASEPTDSEA